MKNPFTRKNDDSPDLEGLKEFSRSSDRSYARFFVGRGEVLADIDNAWQRRMKEWRGGNTKAFDSSTRIVQGAPGAGKTSVGARLERELWNPAHADYMFGEDSRKAPHVVSLDASDLEAPLVVYAKICKKIKPEAEKELNLFQTARDVGGQAGPSLLKGEYRHSKTYQQEPDSPLGTSWLVLENALGKYDWTQPVCLLVDEAQTLEKPGSKFLAGIHKGTHELPIFSLLLGLGNTETRLQRGGISRLEGNAVHTLPALTKDEVEELCNRYFATFRIRGSVQLKQEFATGLHAWSEGWPAHMHNALLGLTRELIQANGNLNTVSCKKSMAHAQGYRNRYYKGRQGEVFGQSPAFLGEFMTGLNSKRQLPARDIQRQIRRARQKAVEEHDDETIGTYSINELLNHLLHQGFIQPNDWGDYVCPIPSLRRWCLTRAGMADPLEGNSKPPSK